MSGREPKPESSELCDALIWGHVAWRPPGGPIRRTEIELSLLFTGFYRSIGASDGDGGPRRIRNADSASDRSLGQPQRTLTSARGRAGEPLKGSGGGCRCSRSQEGFSDSSRSLKRSTSMPRNRVTPSRFGIRSVTMISLASETTE